MSIYIFYFAKKKNFINISNRHPLHEKNLKGYHPCSKLGTFNKIQRNITFFKVTSKPLQSSTILPKYDKLTEEHRTA